MTSIEVLPPDSFPMIVKLVVVVLFNPLFGTKRNEFPTTTWALAMLMSPANVGTVLETELTAFVCWTIRIPTFLFPRMAV